MSTLPEVWCTSCHCPHVATIPARTWKCLHCAFGSWDIITVPRHSERFPHHIVQAQDHHITPVKPEQYEVIWNGGHSNLYRTRAAAEAAVAKSTVPAEIRVTN